MQQFVSWHLQWATSTTCFVVSSREKPAELLIGMAVPFSGTWRRAKSPVFQQCQFVPCLSCNEASNSQLRILRNLVDLLWLYSSFSPPSRFHPDTGGTGG